MPAKGQKRSNRRRETQLARTGRELAGNRPASADRSDRMRADQARPECPSCGQRLQFARRVSNFRVHVAKYAFECKGCGIIIPYEGIAPAAPSEPQSA